MVFAQIEKINENIITVKNEYGLKFNIHPDQVNEFSRINPSVIEEEKEKYLQCLCGCMRFYLQDEKRISNRVRVRVL